MDRPDEAIDYLAHALALRPDDRIIMRHLRRARRLIQQQMGDAERIKQVQDRKKQRREYLKKKWEAYAMVAISGGSTVMFACFAVVWLILVFRTGFSNGVFGIIFFTAVALLFGWLAYREAKTIVTLKHDADNVPYVPPATTSTLPANEILVRGSEEPPAQSVNLLRATQGGETAKEELLRMSQEE